MKICRRCAKNKHYECNGLIFKRVKSLILKIEKTIETSNKCECPCCKIHEEDTSHFSNKLGPDICETKY